MSVTEFKCGWCKEWWTTSPHVCREKSTFTHPCYQCGKEIASKPSGYGLSVDFVGREVRMKHHGYSRNELVCSEACSVSCSIPDPEGA